MCVCVCVCVSVSFCVSFSLIIQMKFVYKVLIFFIRNSKQKSTPINRCHLLPDSLTPNTSNSPVFTFSVFLNIFPNMTFDAPELKKFLVQLSFH